MNLTDIMQGGAAFIDANIFIYAAESRSVQCRDLLKRCDQQAVHGVASTITLAEVCHRRMINEARAGGLISSANLARSLSRKPSAFAQLRVYADNVRDLLDSELHVETVTTQDFYVGLELQKQHGLLTNDSLNLAVMQRLGIREIATADANFDGVQGIIVYKPEDLAL